MRGFANFKRLKPPRDARLILLYAHPIAINRKPLVQQSHLSALLPKANSKRSAISGEIDALAFTISDKVLRDTFKSSAVFVIENPSGLIQSSLNNSPGCGGFCICIKPFRDLKTISKLICEKRCAFMGCFRLIRQRA